MFVKLLLLVLLLLLGEKNTQMVTEKQIQTIPSEFKLLERKTKGLKLSPKLYCLAALSEGILVLYFDDCNTPVRFSSIYSQESLLPGHVEILVTNLGEF